MSLIFAGTPIFHIQVIFSDLKSSVDRGSEKVADNLIVC